MTNVGVLMISSDSAVMTRSESRYCRMAPPRAHHHAQDRADDRADDHQPQADPDSRPQLVAHRLTGHRLTEVAVHVPTSQVA